MQIESLCYDRDAVTSTSLTFKMITEQTDVFKTALKDAAAVDVRHDGVAQLLPLKALKRKLNIFGESVDSSSG